MLHNYLSLLKRVQLILFASNNDGAIADMGQRWLLNHFNSNEIGILPRSGFSDLGIVLNYPQASTARVFTELSPDIPSEVRDAIVLSSCYIAPLVVFGDQNWGRLSPFALWVRRVARLPDEQETLHILHVAMNVASQWFPMAREAYHTILDYLHGDLQPDSIDILLEKRKIQMTKDAEQIFNIVTKSEQGYPILFVADPMRLIAHWLRTMKRSFLVELPWDEFVSAGLGFSVGMVIPPENLRRFMRQEQQGRHSISHRQNFNRQRFR